MTVFRCIHCEAPLDLSPGFACAHCGKSYEPVEGIPLLVRDRGSYLAGMINTYFQFWQQKRREVDKIRQDGAYILSRSRQLRRLTEALVANNSIVAGFVELLEKTGTPLMQVLQACAPIAPILNFKDFSYLKRDWCWFAEGERQLAVIMKTLRAIIDRHLPDKENALFLGSGTGRIALELAGSFREIFATDLSFSMLYFFRQLLAGGEIGFHEINYANTFSDELISRPLTASAKPFLSGSPAVFEGLSYFVSDVKELPLASGSMSSIFSVYFTDVIALKLMLPEISRVLKPGGIFVHFGPLGYGFENIAEKLTASEVKARLEAAGFEISEEAIVISNHLESDHAMDIVRLRNWVLVARKKYADTGGLSRHDSLAVAGNLSYQLNGTIQDGEETRSTRVWTEEGTCFQLNEIGSDVLAELSAAPLSVEALFNLLKETYMLDSPEELSVVLEDLCLKGILRSDRVSS